MGVYVVKKNLGNKEFSPMTSIGIRNEFAGHNILHVKISSKYFGNIHTPK